MSDAPSPSTDDEVARRRDEALARLLKMPPKPHEDMKVGKPKRDRQQRKDDDAPKRTARPA